MTKADGKTNLQWFPTAEQSAVLDWLAMGYSQNATARLTSIPVQTIWSWVNELRFSEQFRAEIARRAELFQSNLEAIEGQQVMIATSIIGRALQGDLPRDTRGNLPAEFVAAVELLRPRWKKRHGEGHKQFGAP